jgi:serine protease Do
MTRRIRFFRLASLSLALLVCAAQAPAAHAATACAERAATAPTSFAGAAARVAPTVVNVVAIRPPRDEEDYGGYEYFPLAGQASTGAPASQRATASGFVADADGHVFTNAHAVADAHEIWATLADGRRLRAALVGLDRRSDVAVLKIDAPGLAVARTASPDKRLCAGDPVAALGAPFGFDDSVTAGIVSAYPRILQGSGGVPLIQTDVALNPGSSGGPLFDPEGAVVGMNSMIFSASGIYIGVSFAVPIDRVLRVAAELRIAGRLQRGHLGTRSQAVTVPLAQAFGLQQAGGALLVHVSATGPGARAGLRPGDVVLALNGKNVLSQDGFEDALEALPPGSRATLQVWRNGAQLRVTSDVADAEAAALPPPASVPAAGQRLGLFLSTSAATMGLPAGVYVDGATGASLLAGIEPGDRVTAVNGMPVADIAQFDAALRHAEAQEGISFIALLVVRGAVALYVPVPRGRRAG